MTTGRVADHRRSVVGAGDLADGAYLVRVMSGLGIRQLGAAPILTRTDHAPYLLPEEQAEVATTVRRLRRMAARVEELYPFGNGMGIAAPQIGIPRRVAIVRPPDGADLIVLINPVVIGRQPVRDRSGKHYEGCLSFFDVRGLVRRPEWIHVRHRTIDGGFLRTVFRGVLARLVEHEIDHLDGVLYRQLLEEGDRLVPVGEYRKFTPIRRPPSGMPLPRTP
ncbi:peptide deformylase [Dactylosporangium fulvum]|uniref:Peptide deformylase n=1 Tax=Dactylosporangium fulvum TaxID=53359 RepID=A0ABY5VZJ0_9ACTN|nr:peptide deformylase [Dactylosporangium fulvum]UWP82429.1 peptide deformylase [Dactylosporangium fulvum]